VDEFTGATCRATSQMPLIVPALASLRPLADVAARGRRPPRRVPTVVSRGDGSARILGGGSYRRGKTLGRRGS
jgi:hypothetical protein